MGHVGEASREMSLDEWCERLPKEHRVNRELRAIRATEPAVGNLLAVIHGDGGQHQQEVGTETACKEAEQIVRLLWTELSDKKEMYESLTGAFEAFVADQYEEVERLRKQRDAAIRELGEWSRKAGRLEEERDKAVQAANLWQQAYRKKMRENTRIRTMSKRRKKAVNMLAHNCNQLVKDALYNLKLYNNAQAELTKEREKNTNLVQRVEEALWSALADDVKGGEGR